MEYRVINKFIDKETKIVYEVGDEYPKGGKKPTKKRIDELKKVHPEHKVAFIEEVKEEKQEG